MEDFKWLKGLLDALTDKPKHKKNIFDIAGFPRWETVNSNILAFFLDQTEEHNCKSLFFESLLELWGENSETQFEGDFEVFREVRTDKGNFIDIVIQSVSNEDEENLDEKPLNWAVIIENKVDSNLHNNLKDYWTSINADKKIAFVLSKENIELSKYNQNGITYKSITHKALMEKVQKNLHHYFSEVNEKYLLFLKEFILNTNNFYNSNRMQRDNEKTLEQFQNHQKNILAFKKQEKELLKFVSEIVFEEFENNKFSASSKGYSKGKHFYPENNPFCNGDIFRFFVDIDALRYERTFTAYFEIHNKANTCYGSKVIEVLKKKEIFTNTVEEGIGGNDKAAYNHVYAIEIPIPEFSEIGYKEALSQALNTQFWNHNNKFLTEAQAAFDEVSKEG